LKDNSDLFKKIKENEIRKNENYDRAVINQNGKQYEFNVLDSIIYNEKQYALAAAPNGGDDAFIIKSLSAGSTYELLSQGAEYLEIANLFKDKGDFKITEI
jgi:hypothetical protein